MQYVKPVLWALFMVLPGISTSAYSQTQYVECGSYCEWTDVKIVEENPGTRYNIKSVVSFLKTDRRQSLGDFAEKELKKIKKKARKYNTCTVIMSRKALDDKTRAHDKHEYIYFYIIKPVIPLTREDKN